MGESWKHVKSRNGLPKISHSYKILEVANIQRWVEGSESRRAPREVLG